MSAGAYIVAEGPADAELLRAALDAEGIRDTEVVDAGGRGNMLMAAVTLATSRRKPVAMVLDADSSKDDPDRLDDRSLERFIEGYSAAPARVVTVEPSLGALAASSGLAVRLLSAATQGVGQGALPRADAVDRRAAASAVAGLPPVRRVLDFVKAQAADG
jgi:hypothetical protein